LLHILTSPSESDDDVGAKIQQNQEALSDSSYSSVGLPEEAVAIDSESENEQLRSCSPALPEQVAKTEYAIEQYSTEPGLPKTTVSSTSAKKKRKGKVASKLQFSVDSPYEHPVE
jgi:hypothetical protein